MSVQIPRVVADGPLAPAILELISTKVEILPWEFTKSGLHPEVTGLYTYGHPSVDGAMMDRLPGLKVISNYGVGVDHIRLQDAKARRIPVGNTPGILDGATADMAMALLLAVARRVVEGDRYARSSEFTIYDPGFMLGSEVHGATIGIIGMGRIGTQIARRAAGFSMRILYHNRHRRPEIEKELGVIHATREQLLNESDYVVLSAPLTPQTRGLIDQAALSLMKNSAYLINVARGALVNHEALADCLTAGGIAGAALDVTDPEPLPRDHPLLSLKNLVIVPHLGSATRQTRQKMAEISVENLLRGIQGEPLLFTVET